MTSESDSLESKLDNEPNPLKRFFRMLGPGLITGASDDDPSGIGTYTMAGAAFGFSTLWTALVTLPLMIVVQYLCAKIGMVSGMGLAGVLRAHYSRKLLYLSVLGLVIANTINIGADIAAVAAAVSMLTGLPNVWLIVPIAVLIVAMQLWGSYRLIVNVFKWLTLALFAYIVAAFLAKPDWGAVLRATFMPSPQFDSKYLTMLVAILGTTISPYLFFWQANQEVEEEVMMGRTTLSQREGATYAELRYAAWDTTVGMIFCSLIFYFIILTSGATLHVAGKTEIASAVEAAQALRPLAGQYASVLFALGIIGSGFLAIPVLSGSCAYAVSEALGWECSLSDKVGDAKAFYAVIGVSTLVGVGLDFLGINPMKALLWTAVINGTIAPPLLVVIMLVSNNRKVMGDHVNGLVTNVVGWTATATMFAATIGMVFTWNQT